MSMTPKLAGAGRSAQHGAALVVGLILLLVLTVLGVSGLGTATTEVRLADNNKQREHTFQAAESGIRAVLRNGGLMTLDNAEVENQPMRAMREFTFNHNNADSSVVDANIEVDVNTLYRGRGFPASEACGYYDASTTSMVHMVLDSRAVGSRGSRSSVRQGFCIPAPRQ